MEPKMLYTPLHLLLGILFPIIKMQLLLLFFQNFFKIYTKFLKLIMKKAILFANFKIICRLKSNQIVKLLAIIELK